MICIPCKRMLSDRNVFCPDCGTPTVAYNCQCGNALSYTQKFCEHCGQPVPEKPAPVVEVQS